MWSSRPCLEDSRAVAGEEDDLDKFVNSPYGNGLSQEMNTEIKQKELTNIKETIK